MLFPVCLRFSHDLLNQAAQKEKPPAGNRPAAAKRKCKMDYTLLTFRAVVDWIELEIHTAKPTNFWAIQNALREIQHLPADVNPYVKPLNESAGGAATAFLFRIQDPERLCDANKQLEELAHYAFNIDAKRVNAIEIALDAYNANPEQVARLYKFSTHLVSANHRLYRERNVDKVQATPRSFDSLVRRLSEGWQIGIGDEGADHYQHIYWKTTDDNGNPLPVSEHRARIEIRLRGAELPCQTFEDWENFSFSTLSKFFRFRKLKADLTPQQQVIANASAQIGQQRKRNRRGGGTLLHSRITQADVELNDRARDALRELSRRWKAEPKRSKKQTTGRTPPTAQNESACGNTGELKPANPHERSKEEGGSNNYLCSALHTSDSIIHQYNEAQRADSTDTDKHTIESDALRLSRLSDSTDEDNGETMTPEMLRISRLMEINDDDLLNVIPELEAEQKRIDNLMEDDETRPH